MISNFTCFSFALLFCALIAELSFAQEKNPTTWPYGGVPDSSNYVFVGKERIHPLKFSIAYFRNSHFDEPIDFKNARFESIALFEGSLFKHKTDFSWTSFGDLANFERVVFQDSVNFHQAGFFGNIAEFRSAEFNGPVNFTSVYFDSVSNFAFVNFGSSVNFYNSHFKNEMSFFQAFFFGKIDFREAYCDSLAEVDFSRATIKDTILIGSRYKKSGYDLQKYDFQRAKLLPDGQTKISADSTKNKLNKISKYPGAIIIIYGPVDLKMQLEKLAFVELCDTLDYFAKKDIISVLKEQSFKDDKAAKFELDYMFAKSAMYQSFGES